MRCRLPEGVLRFDGDGTGQGQGAVEPRFAQEAAVDFGVDFEIALFADFRTLFDAQAGEISVSRAEAKVAADLSARPKGDEARPVDRDVVSSVALKVPRCFF